MQTNAWWINKSNDRQKRNDANRKRDRKPFFKPTQIYRRKQEILRFNTQWRKFFLKYSIPYHEITYEMLTSNFNHSMQEVLHFLEIETGSSVFKMATKKQSSTLNERWMFYYQLIPEILLQKYVEFQS